MAKITNTRLLICGLNKQYEYGEYSRGRHAIGKPRIYKLETTKTIFKYFI